MARRYPWQDWEDGRVHEVLLEPGPEQPFPTHALINSLQVRARRQQRTVGWSDAGYQDGRYVVRLQFDPPDDSELQKFYPSRRGAASVESRVVA